MARRVDHADAAARVGGSGIILVDSRAGSCDLARWIVPQSHVRIARDLPTDIVFTGWGPGEARCEIGIEYKRLDDVLKCIATGRFAGNQLPDLCEYDFAFLLVEGIFRRASAERGERIEVWCSPAGKPRGWYDTAECGWGQRIWRMDELDHWLLTQQLCTRATRCGGVVLLPYTPSKQASGLTVATVHSWFNDKLFEEHRSHLAMDKSHLAPLRGSLSLLLRAASEIGGLGPKGALAAERAFGSWQRAGNATADEWADLRIGGEVRGGKRGKPRRLGRKRAEAIVREITTPES